MAAEAEGAPTAVALDLRLHFRGAYHVRASGATAGLVDAHLLVRPGPECTLVIPGSTIKGRLRDHASRLWRAARGAPPCSGEDGCLLCQVFGAGAGARGPLRFHDAVLCGAGPLATRTSVGIAPATRTAARGLLYTVQVSPVDLTFVAGVRGHLAAARAEAALGLLAGAAALLRTLGAAKSRGLGWTEAGVARARLGDRELTPSELRRAFAREVLGR